MRAAVRLAVIAGLAAGASFTLSHAASAQGNTDLEHSRCSQGGSPTVTPVFGGSDSAMAALRDPNADHGAAGALFFPPSIGGSGSSGRTAGLGGSNLQGGGAGGCEHPPIEMAKARILPVTGAEIGRLALLGGAFAAAGLSMLLLAREQSKLAAAK